MASEQLETDLEAADAEVAEAIAAQEKSKAEHAALTETMEAQQVGCRRYEVGPGRC
jgi:structural maintenance of chromosome 2